MYKCTILNNGYYKYHDASNQFDAWRFIEQQGRSAVNMHTSKVYDVSSSRTYHDGDIEYRVIKNSDGLTIKKGDKKIFDAKMQMGSSYPTLTF